MNAPFSIRASSLAELFDCPARWEAKHIRGLRLPIGGAGRMGTAIHEGTTLHDFATLNDTSVSIDDCESVLVDAIWKPTEDVDWTDTDQKSRWPGDLGLERLPIYAGGYEPRWV